MIEEYLHRDTGDLVEAAQWQGHLDIFQTWMNRYGGVPISLVPLPALTLINCPGNAVGNKPTQILIKVDDWVVLHRETHTFSVVAPGDFNGRYNRCPAYPK
jgi:hypothetical protein